LENQLSAYKINISTTNDSLISLHKQLSQANIITNTVKTKTTEKLYTIKKGDGFCTISSQIYGTQKYGKEIADYNRLDYNNTIYPGKIIRLPLK